MENGLLRLPNELLAEIMTSPELDLDTLLNAALSSRRLHAITLPVYLTRSKIPDPTTISNLVITPGRRAHPLSGLQVSLSIVPFIQKLFCTFPDPLSEINNLYNQIRGVRNVIYNLTAVGEVTLVMDTVNYGNVIGTDAKLTEWSHTIEALLNAIIERSCQSLTLRLGRFMMHSYHMSHDDDHPSFTGIPASEGYGRHPLAVEPTERDNTMTRDHSPVIRGPGWRFYRPPHQGATVVLTHLSREGQSSSNLKHLSLQSSILLLPPCSSWTMSVLQHSPISRLEFTSVLVAGGIWSAMLPLITERVPNLSELSITDCEAILPVDLLGCLLRLPYLTNFSYETRTHHPCGASPVPAFQNLRTLRAPPKWVSHFLKPTSSLPMLSTLIICALDRLLAAGLSPLYALHETLSDLQGRTPISSITLEAYVGNTPFQWVSKDLEAAPLLNHDLLSTFQGTVTFVLEGRNPFPQQIDLVVRWLALFPAFRHLSVRRERGFYGFQCDLVGDDSLQTSALLRPAMIQSFPCVEKLTVYDIPYDLTPDSDDC